MKKLLNKKNELHNTVEAYACSCGSSCSCKNACSCGVLSFNSTNVHTSLLSVYETNWNSDRKSSNYKK